MENCKMAIHYHKCKNCGKDIFCELGPNSNGDTIVEYLVPLCECNSQAEESQNSTPNKQMPKSLCDSCVSDCILEDLELGNEFEVSRCPKYRA